MRESKVVSRKSSRKSRELQRATIRCLHARPPAVAVGEPAGRAALGAGGRHALPTLGAAEERRRLTQPVWLQLPRSRRWSSLRSCLPTQIATSVRGPHPSPAFPLLTHLHCGRIQASLQCGRRLQRRRSAAKCYTQRGSSLSMGSSGSLLQGGSELDWGRLRLELLRGLDGRAASACACLREPHSARAAPRDRFWRHVQCREYSCVRASRPDFRWMPVTQVSVGAKRTL